MTDVTESVLRSCFAVVYRWAWSDPRALKTLSELKLLDPDSVHLCKSPLVANLPVAPHLAADMQIQQMI